MITIAHRAQVFDVHNNILILQVVNGYLQVRYNLGSGEALTQQNTVRVDNEQFHNVTITRVERELEMIIDGLYVNRTTSSGSEATLDVSVTALYLGAGYNGTATNGFVGCVTGFTLDRKEVPFASDSIDFAILTNFEGISGGCPIGSLNETPRADEQVFPVIAGIILGLFILSASFVIVCMIGQWYRNRRSGGHRVNNLRRDSTRSRRSWNFRETNPSPMQEAFQWQAAPTYKQDMSIPPGNYRSTPEHIPAPLPDTTFNFNMNNRNPSPEYTTEVAETGFYAPSRRSSVRNARPTKISRPEEGFAFSQSNQSYCDDIDLGQAELAQPKHARTMSGHQSILSASTVATTSLQDDAEVVNYLSKRTNIADSEIVELSFDEMVHYKEEGPYQPLGSIDSLLDFVNELDVPQYGHPRKDMYQFPADTPIASRQGTPTTHVPIVYQLHSQVPAKTNKEQSKTEKTSPLTGQRFEGFTEEKVPDPQTKTETGKGRSKAARRSGRDPHAKKMENILDRFHDITSGHMPDEGRLI